MWKEFKQFAMRGNVTDMAIGVIIGGAFGNVVTSLVNDVLMPPLSFLIGKLNLSEHYLNLSRTKYESLQAAKEAGAPTLNYGMFLTTVADFLVVSAAIYLVIRQINRFRSRQEQAPPTAEPVLKSCRYCMAPVDARAVRCPSCTSHLGIRTTIRSG